MPNQVQAMLIFVVKITVNLDANATAIIISLFQIKKNQIKSMNIIITMVLHHIKVQYLIHNSKEYLCLHT